MTTYAHNTIVAMLKELFEARSDNPHPDWLGALWDSFPEIGAQQVIDAGDALRILLKRLKVNTAKWWNSTS